MYIIILGFLKLSRFFGPEGYERWKKLPGGNIEGLESLGLPERGIL